MAVWTPSRVVLISRGRHDEAVADADCYPGMALVLKANGNVIPHNVVGGTGPLLVAKEEALRGGDITQKLTSGDVIPFQRPAKGDLLVMLLQNGQNVANQTPLMSAGDGTLIAGQTNKLYEIVAASAVVTNTNVETTFSNGSFAVPANTLAAGDVLRIHSKAFCIAVAAAATQRVRTYVGATVLADSAAQALVANDVVITDVLMTVRTVGAGGTFVADGVVTYSIAGTFTEVPFTVASTAIDTTVAETIKTTVLASAAAAGNQIRLDEFQIDLIRGGGVSSLVYANEAINNSTGTGTSGFSSAALIRVMVP